MSLHLLSLDYHVLNMKTRLPFKYGIATLTAVPYFMVRVEIEADGKRGTGVSSEGLAPKWFTKDPETTFEQDIGDMMEVILAAGRHATGLGNATTVFEFWHNLYEAQKGWAQGTNHPPLLWAFGVSMIERAVVDAFCRAHATSFSTALRSNAFNIDLSFIHGELKPGPPADFLTSKPLQKIGVRHTVGLADPVTEQDVPADEVLDDGLPQTLEQAIKAYGLKYFKIKVQDDVDAAVDRLRAINGAIESNSSGEYAFSLDGNESFLEAAGFVEFWNKLSAEPTLKDFFSHLLFVEQPMHRDIALNDEEGRTLNNWKNKPLIIIDEADGELDRLPTALRRGYCGTSHKNCKGVMKGIANTCLIRHLNREHPESVYVISGEDMCSVGPIAMWQDLAVVASLGIEHVERNGHHYYKGLSMWPDKVQEEVLKHHGDFYTRHDGGFPSLDVHDGVVDLKSVVDAPFGYGFEFDPGCFTPVAEWTYSSLEG